MLRKRPKEQSPHLLNPGDPEPEACAPGSIEQQLDMCESGSLRGDEILHHHGITEEAAPLPAVPPVDRLLDRYEIDLAEEGREGSELTGDEHSSGLQGGEAELRGQLHLTTGLPGDLSSRTELFERSDWTSREDLAEGIPQQTTDQNVRKAKRPPRSRRVSNG